MADVTNSALAALAAHFRSNVTGLTVREEWPYANEKLAYPTLTISTNKPKRMPEAFPYAISVTDPNVSNQVTAREVVASWEDTFQLDLWCKDKLQRKQVTDQILALFEPASMDTPDGLSLQMSDHFNEWCRYEIDDVQSIDDEAAAQRQERREKITVLVNCREIKERTYYAMMNIQVKSQVTTQAEDLTDTVTGTESYQVPS